MHGVEVRPARSIAELRACLKGEADWPDPPPSLPTTPAEPDATTSRRPRRRARPPARTARARGRRRRRAPRAAHRAARHGQDDARPPAPDDPAAARRRRGARGHAHPLRRRPCAAARSGAPTPVPRAAPHRVDGRARRRRLEPAPPGRGDARAPRCAVPRRAGRVPAARARRAAPAARGARRAHLAPGDVARVPCRLPARRVLEPVPVRSRRAELRVHRDAARAVPPPAVGAAARPLRPPPRGAPARARRRARRVVGHGARPRRRGRRAPAGALRAPAVAPERARPRGRARPGDPAVHGRRRRLALGDRARRTHGPRARRASGGSPARSPTSTAAPRSATPRRPRRRCSARTCRERDPTRGWRGRGRGGDARLPPRHGPGRLRAVLDRWPDPGAALAAVRDGKAGDALAPDARRSVATSATRWPTAGRARHGALDLAAGAAPGAAPRVVLDGDADYPIGDEVPDRPAVLLVEGAAPDVLAGHGSRSSAPAPRRVHGLADARELGAFLARRGVTVVSGLAIGIDGAAHEGALDAGGGVVGVVATGLDVVYPRRHVVLFERVRGAGVLLSEAGFGARPTASASPFATGSSPRSPTSSWSSRRRCAAAPASPPTTARVRPARARGARLAAQPGGRRVQRAARRRRPPAPRPRRRARRPRPDAGLPARLGRPAAARHARAPTARASSRPAPAKPRRSTSSPAAPGCHRRRSRSRSRALERQGWVEHRRGWWWPR